MAWLHHVVLAEHMQELLYSVAADADTPTHQLNMMAGPELQQVLEDFNNTETLALPTHLTYVDFFQQQAAKSPDRPCVMFEGETLSYAQVERRANQLAHLLVSLGVGPEVAVGLHVHRCLDLMTMILAVMKAGGYYVPLDPTYPKDRLEFVMQDSEVLVLLTQHELRKTLAVEPGTQVVVVDEDWEARVSNQPTTPFLPPRAKPENLCYSIHTSGSTGKPKGVMVEHRNLVCFTSYFLNKYEVSPHDICMLKASISFDFSVAEYAGMMACGGCLLLLKPGGETDVQYQLDLVRNHKVRGGGHNVQRRSSSSQGIGCSSQGMGCSSQWIGCSIQGIGCRSQGIGSSCSPCLIDILTAVPLPLANCCPTPLALARMQVTIFMGVPSLLQTVFAHATVSDCSSLRLVLAGGLPAARLVCPLVG